MATLRMQVQLPLVTSINTVREWWKQSWTASETCAAACHYQREVKPTVRTWVQGKGIVESPTGPGPHSFHPYIPLSFVTNDECAYFWHTYNHNNLSLQKEQFLETHKGTSHVCWVRSCYQRCWSEQGEEEVEAWPREAESPWRTTGVLWHCRASQVSPACFKVTKSLLLCLSVLKSWSPTLWLVSPHPGWTLEVVLWEVPCFAPCFLVGNTVFFME